MILLAAPAAGAAPSFAPSVGDVVLPRPSVASARISASASAQRYPVNDGSHATIAVAVTEACQTDCLDADPPAIASFVALRNRAGELLRTLRPGLGRDRQLSYAVCGQSRLGIVIAPAARSSATFRLQVQRP